MSSGISLKPLLAAALLIGQAVADEAPGPLAPDSEKLTYLFSTWRGQSVETLKAVWGRPESVETRGETETYEFRRVKRGPTFGLGGVTVAGRGAVVCSAYFRVALEGVVTRATWRGPSADDCWGLFRAITPPAAEE
jgi:hypothetical protein